MINAVLLCIGLWVSRKDYKALALVCLIGAGVFVVVPAKTANQWFAMCIIGEIFIILLARMLKTIAADVVCLIGYGLILVHIVGWLGWGSFGAGSYRSIVPMLEYSQQLVCILFCPFILNKIKDYHARNP